MTRNKPPPCRNYANSTDPIIFLVFMVVFFFAAKAEASR